MIVGAGALVVLLGGIIFGYQKAEDYYSLENQVDRYKTLQSRDKAKIASVLSTSEEGLEITEESIAPYVGNFLFDID